MIGAYLGAPVVPRGNELMLLSLDDAVCRKFQMLVDRIVSFFIGAETADFAVSGTCDASTDFSGSDERRSFFGREIPSGKKKETPLLDASIFSGLIQSVEYAECAGFSMSSFIEIPHAYRKVFPKTVKQAEFLSKVENSGIIFCEGLAGARKTFLVLAEALFLLSKRIQRIVPTGSVVEAGENPGFSPDDVGQKRNPYVRPLYDAMEKLLLREIIRRFVVSSAIEIAPYCAYARTDHG